MDDYSGKRAGDGLVLPRKGSSVVLRDNANSRDRNSPFCNRIGCSGRLNSAKGSQISFSEKAKSSRTVFRPSSTGKEIAGSSSRSCSATNKPRKSFPEPRKKLASQVETDSSESGSILEEPEVPELAPPSRKIQRGLRLESEEAGFGETPSMEAGSSSMATSSRSRRLFHKKSGLDNTNSVVSSSISLSSRNASQGTRGTTNRYVMRNLRCDSPSDVASTGSSSSDSNSNRKKDVIKKRTCDGDSSSSSGGKKSSGPSSEGRKSSSSLGISISDSRQTRSAHPNRDTGAPSVRTRRSLNGYTRARIANQGSGHNIPPEECHVISQMPQLDLPFDLNAPTQSHHFSVESSSSRPSPYGRPGSGNESLRGIRPSSPAELGNGRSIVNRDSFRRYNMDGIAEVLLALERIEHDEELTYEQLLVLEANLFLNGLNFHDQHRDMRLDIDNMSYEELLALEERMGTVCTALSEEELSECIKASIHQPPPVEDTTGGHCGNKDDVKCSICQEEYVVGDETGRLKCEHRYHVVCIQQWLRMKNWCPICKASAAPSSSSSSSLPSSS
ncbi:hypothetical protein Tsubulata_030861 [Turnera subulata]|uniref:RING-type E3 ubiquitin transferase n=1 Tax=Turnera subulata TaxID=218843 RepID=A0A9Q0FT05_9ROSI|nr:hypothetical protein Tsubulata_030861 [Turnera subulata]